MAVCRSKRAVWHAVWLMPIPVLTGVKYMKQQILFSTREDGLGLFLPFFFLKLNLHAFWIYIFNLRLSTLSIWVTVLTLRIDFCTDKVCIKGLFHFFNCENLGGGRKKLCTVFGRVVPSSGSLLPSPPSLQLTVHRSLPVSFTIVTWYRTVCFFYLFVKVASLQMCLLNMYDINDYIVMIKREMHFYTETHLMCFFEV